jgi:hypothetical protein
VKSRAVGYRPFGAEVRFTLAFCRIRAFAIPDAGKLTGINRPFRGYRGLRLRWANIPSLESFQALPNGKSLSTDVFYRALPTPLFRPLFPAEASGAHGE